MTAHAVAPIPLSHLTTLRTGGVPERMVEASTRDDLISAMREAWSAGDEVLVLGGGSNLLVGDEPFAGTVVRVRSTGIEREDAAASGDRVRVRVQAGHSWDGFVAWTIEQGLAGVEALSGIPGTVGAAPVQNIGAYGQEIVQTLVEVELIDEATGEVSTVPADELALGFRTSVLKAHYGSVAVRPAVVLSATFALADVGHASLPVRGDQLRTALGLGPDDRVSLAEIREQVLATRARKGMVLDPRDPDTASAGSFFQNAVVSQEFAATLPAACPRWPMPLPAGDADALVIPLASYGGVPMRPDPGSREVKVSAAWLIEHAGLGKGFRLGRSRAALSSKHALALTNRGGASAEEIAQLARFIQQRVQQDFGLILQPEPVLVGVEL